MLRLHLKPGPDKAKHACQVALKSKISITFNSQE